MMKKLISIAMTLVALFIMVLAFRPSAIPVETATVSKGLFNKVVEDDGKTRPIDTYVITAPARGNLLRIDAKSGDPVSKNQVIAKIIPATSQLLDIREELQLEQRKEAAKAALLRAGVLTERAKAALDNAKIDYKRGFALSKKGFVSKSELEKLKLDVDLKEKEYESAQYNKRSAESDLKRTEFALKHFKRAYTPEQNSDSALEITSPINGNIIKIYRDSEGAIMSGSKILKWPMSIKLKLSPIF